MVTAAASARSWGIVAGHDIGWTVGTRCVVVVAGYVYGFAIGSLRCNYGSDLSHKTLNIWIIISTQMTQGGQHKPPAVQVKPKRQLFVGQHVTLAHGLSPGVLGSSTSWRSTTPATARPRQPGRSWCREGEAGDQGRPGTFGATVGWVIGPACLANAKLTGRSLRQSG